MLKTIYLDLDDVVFDTENHIRRLVDQKWSDNGRLMYCEYSNFSASERRIVASMFADYSTIPLIDGAIDGINTLLTKYNIKFCTSVQSRLEAIAKEELAKEWGISIIICGAVKSHLDMRGSIFVDNRGDHLDDSNADIKVLFHKEYCSKSETADKVVYNWEELVDYLMGL